MLIIPDVHGRSFWKEAVMRHPEEKIIFLGDYLDPYPQEWDIDPYDIKAEQQFLRDTINNFKEILELKKQRPNDVILLMGNHDMGYLDEEVCSCRHDRINHNEIKQLFEDNRDLFQLAHEEYILGKHYLFSHAGISEEYAKYCFSDDITEDSVVGAFNDAWKDNNWMILSSLSKCDFYRSWDGGDWASLVWTDVREFVSGISHFWGYQVVGHTQLERPYFGKRFCCLDCRRAFLIDNNGKITEDE